MYRAEDYFDLSGCLSEDFLKSFEYIWQALPEIKNFILDLQKKLPREEYEEWGENVYVHKNAKVDETAIIQGATIIAENVEIRPYSFIRANALVEARTLIGYNCELKNVIILPDTQVAHFNYCGDSILGRHSHMACGAITSNLKVDHSLVTVDNGKEKIATNLKKFGAIIGDNTEVGCNAVLNPGSLLGPESRVYPLSMIRGVLPANSIFKNNGEVVKIDD